MTIPFQAICENGFLELALIAFFSGKQQTFHDLLGYGAPALRARSGFEVHEERAEYGHGADAGMLVESVILSGKKGQRHILGHFGKRREETLFPVKIPHDALVSGIDRGDKRRPVDRKSVV